MTSLDFPPDFPTDFPVQDTSEMVVKKPNREIATVPAWAFVIFGALCVTVALCVFLMTTRCPCDRSDGDADGDVDGDADVSTPPTTSNDHVSSFIIAWVGDEPADTQLAFLLNTDPYHTYICNAKTLFSSHSRVRVTLPRGEYLVRAQFTNGTQRVAEGTWHGDVLVSVSDQTLECEGKSTDFAVAPAPSEACM